MSSPQPLATNDGLVGNVAFGYDAARTAWRPVLAVLLPVVAAMLAVSSLLDLMLGDGRLVIVDGIAEPRGADVLAWAKLATTVSFWLIGLIAGARAITHDTGPVESLGHAVKHLPAFAIGVIAATGCLFLALWMVAVVATGRLAVILITGVLVAAALAAARVLLSGTAWALDGSDRMPAWVEAASFLLGGVAVPLLLAYGVNRFAIGPYARPLLLTALIVVVLAAQAGMAARPHVPDGTQQRPARLWPGVAMVTAAVVASAGLVLANPYAAPVVRTHDRGPASAVAVAWPAGRHPVIVTTTGVWFCDDDLCADVTDVSGGPPTIEDYGTAGIGVDGTVVKTAVTGGPDKGGPFVHYARCVREGCREAWLPVRVNATEKLDLQAEVEAVGAVAPDGALWLFVATPIPHGKLGRYRFSLIRCADVPCTSPQRHQVGTADRSPEDRYPNGRRARLSIGADGRPAASFWTGRSILRYSCEPVTCASPRESADSAAPPDAAWNATGDSTVSFRAGELYGGTDTAMIAGDAAPESGALAVAGSLVYVAAALPSDPSSGFHLALGEPLTFWRQTVWRCAGFNCVSSPMDVYEGEARRALLAVAGDGRVLVVRDDRIVLLETPFG